MKGLTRRSQAAAVCLSVYAVCTLISMATMSIGLLFVAAAIGILHSGLAGGSQPILNLWQKPAVKRYVWASAVLAVACIVSLLAATLYPVSMAGSAILVSWPKDILKLWFLILPLLHLFIFSQLSAEQFGRVIRTWLGAVLVLSIIGLAQRYSGWPRPQPIPGDPSGRFHVTLFLGHHLSVASIWVFPVFFALDSFWQRRRESGAWFYLAVTVASGTALVFTYARSVWLWLPVGVVVWLFLRLEKKSALIGAACLFILGTLFYHSEGVHHRLNQMGTMGVNERVELWEANYDFFKLRPITGLGWKKASDLSGPYLKQKHPERQSVFAGHAHNNALEMLASTGLFGLLAWLFWSGLILVSLLRLARRANPPPGVGGLFAGWVVFHLLGMTQVNFWEGKVIHQVMWVTALGLAFSSGPWRTDLLKRH